MKKPSSFWPLNLILAVVVSLGLLLLIIAWIVGQRNIERMLLQLATLFSEKIIRRGRFWSSNDEVHLLHRGVPVVFRFSKDIGRLHGPIASPELVFDSGFHLDCQVWPQPPEDSAETSQPSRLDFARLKYPRDVLIGEPEFDRRFVTLAHDAVAARRFLTPAVQRVLLQFAEKVTSWGEREVGSHLRVEGTTLVLARRGMCLEFEQLVEFVSISLSLVDAARMAAAGEAEVIAAG